MFPGTSKKQGWLLPKYFFSLVIGRRSELIKVPVIPASHLSRAFQRLVSLAGLLEEKNSNGERMQLIIQLLG